MRRRPASWVARTTASTADHPREPRRSKQASCGLTPTHEGPAASIAARQWRSTASAVSVPASTAPRHRAAGSGARPGPNWLGGSPTRARGRGRGGGGGGSRSANARLTRPPDVLRLARLDGVLQSRARAEARHAAGGDLAPLAGLRVHALASAAVGHRELAEAREADLAPTAERLLDDVQHGVDRVARFLLPET